MFATEQKISLRTSFAIIYPGCKILDSSSFLFLLCTQAQTLMKCIDMQGGLAARWQTIRLSSRNGVGWIGLYLPLVSLAKLKLKLKLKRMPKLKLIKISRNGVGWIGLYLLLVSLAKLKLKLKLNEYQS